MRSEGFPPPGPLGQTARDLPLTPPYPLLASPAMVVAPSTSVETLCINSIRFLAIDAINKSNSGHPGLPMGCAPMSYALWDKVLKHNPKNPKWFNQIGRAHV